MTKREIILGIGGLRHSAAACLMVDGRIVAACEEERASRVKNDAGFPRRAARLCLDEAGFALDDVTAVALAQPLPEPGGGDSELEALLLSPKAILVPHHLAHAAGVFFSSGLGKAAFLCVDYPAGSAAIAGGSISRVGHAHYFSSNLPFSPALLYSAATAFLGFQPRQDEYIVMGLAAYGTSARLAQMQRLIKFDEAQAADLTRRFTELFGMPRMPDEPLEKKHADIAFALQRVTQDAVLALVKRMRGLSRSENLCYCGELALNCGINTAVAESGLFRNVFIHPAAHDAGTCIGAAYYVDRFIRRNKRRDPGIEDVYLGPGFSEADVRAALDPARFDFQELDEYALAQECALDLAAGKIVAWCQGRMEWGPRALGHRSILADPRDAGIAERINRVIKCRHRFRPFAPSVLAEAVEEYFDVPAGADLSRMLFLARAKERAVEETPAIVHVDGTSRIQAVSFTHDPQYWKLIMKFKQLTGTPMLLNTSFNRKGEPLVGTPADALACFSETDIDVLYLANMRVVKLKPQVCAQAPRVSQGGVRGVPEMAALRC